MVEFGVFHDLQSIFYSAESDEDLLTVFPQLEKCVLCKSLKCKNKLMDDDRLEEGLLRYFRVPIIP
jgi:hypothetical protein